MNRRPQLVESIKNFEGLRLFPYRDTKGHWTIGWGHNLDAKPLNWYRFPVTIPRYLAEAILQQDVDDAIHDLDIYLPWWRELDDVRQQVIADLCFNMGIGNEGHGLRSFVNTLPAVREGRWQDARDGLLASKWAKDVGDRRALPLVEMMLTGRPST